MPITVEAVRTYVRVERGDDPACRPRRVLRVGRAARRPSAARAARDRRGRGRARGQLRGQGLRRPHGDGRRAGPPAVPAGDRRPAAHVGLLRGEQGGVPRCSSDTTPLVEGLSIDEAFLDVRGMRRIAGTPVEIAVRLRRDVLERVGLPITVGVARTKFLAKVASGVAKPDGLLVVPPDGELGVPAPAAGRAALGRRAGDRRQAARPGDHDRRPGRAARRGGARLDARAGGRAGTSTRSPTTAIRGRCGCGRRRGSIGSQRALGRSPRSPEAVDAVVVGLVDRVTRRMRAAGRVGRTVVLRLRFDDFSRATRSHTLPARDRADPDDPRHGARAARDGACR